VSGFSETRLPEGWASAQIDQLFAVLEDGRTLHQGWSPQCEKNPSTSTEEWGVLKTSAIQSGAFLPEHNKRLPLHLPPRVKVEVRSGDILITCAGPRSRCGVACLVRSTRPKLILSGKMYRFRVPEAHFDSRYLEAFLQTSAAQHSIDRMKTGGSDSGLNLTHDRFRQLDVPVAPLNEQRRIVAKLEELLSELDAGVESLETAREQLKVYHQALLKHAFEGKLTAAWRAQNADRLESAEELLEPINSRRRQNWETEQSLERGAFRSAGRKRYQQPAEPDTSELAALPVGWTWTSLDALTDGIRGGSTAKPADKKTPWPVLRSSSVRPGSVDFTDVSYLAGEQSTNDAFFLREGDLLITRLSGSLDYVGNCAVVRNLGEQRIQFPDRLFAARPVFSSLGRLIELAFASGYSRDRIRREAMSSAGHQRIAIRNLVGHPIPLPPLAEQAIILDEVERRISVVRSLSEEITRQFKVAEALRQSILKRAFSGQLVPQDPGDEPASVLLERIRAEKGDVGSGTPARRSSRGRKYANR
jgi:type I restriction enzyme S subunit